MKYISQRGLDLIKRFEGFSAKPYLCPAGVWTIGYGSTNNVDKDSKPVDKDEAETLLREALMPITLDLNRIVPDTLTQNQFDSLCSFCYNLGFGAFMSSTLRKVIERNPDDYEHIRKEFMRWVNVNGKKMNGLIKRREAEADLYCACYEED